MRNNRLISLLACVITAGSTLAGPCSAGAAELSFPRHEAEGLPMTHATADQAVLPSGLLAMDEPSVSAIGTPIDAAVLERLRGGDGTVDNDVLIDGTVGGNTADHIVSGANAISDGSFANASGINTVIQNTGSNVLIQNGMVVNVQFVAPTP